MIALHHLTFMVSGSKLLTSIFLHILISQDFLFNSLTNIVFMSAYIFLSPLHYPGHTLNEYTPPFNEFLSLKISGNLLNVSNIKSQSLAVSKSIKSSDKLVSLLYMLLSSL